MLFLYIISRQRLLIYLDCRYHILAAVYFQCVPVGHGGLSVISHGKVRRFKSLVYRSAKDHVCNIVKMI